MLQKHLQNRKLLLLTLKVLGGSMLERQLRYTVLLLVTMLQEGDRIRGALQRTQRKKVKTKYMISQYLKKNLKVGS